VADSPELQAARDRVGAAISEFASILMAEIYGADGRDPVPELDPAQAGEPLVVAWVAGFEATNMQLEQGRQAFRQGFGSMDQTISAGEGLGRVIVRAYS
jgi:hypothetical protein